MSLFTVSSSPSLPHVLSRMNGPIAHFLSASVNAYMCPFITAVASVSSSFPPSSLPVCIYCRGTTLGEHGTSKIQDAHKVAETRVLKKKKSEFSNNSISNKSRSTLQLLSAFLGFIYMTRTRMKDT